MIFFKIILYNTTSYMNDMLNENMKEGEGTKQVSIISLLINACTKGNNGVYFLFRRQ